MATRRIGLEQIQMIPLGAAWLCQDCQTVSNLSTDCPACGSAALLCLAGVMDREDSMVLTLAPEGMEALCAS